MIPGQPEDQAASGCVRRPSDDHRFVGRESITPAGWEDADWYAETRFSPALASGDVIFVSGCSGADVYPDDVPAQIRQAYRYVSEVLEAAGSDWHAVVSITTYHTDLHGHMNDVIKIHREFITTPPYPAWTAVGVRELLQPNAVLEVSVIAYRGNGSLNHPPL
jgi:enamine deaminase RidA (YjgF/YER057c/UK114 family)